MNLVCDVAEHPKAIAHQRAVQNTLRADSVHKAAITKIAMHGVVTGGRGGHEVKSGFVIVLHL